MSSTFSPLQAWHAGQSAGTADAYIKRVEIAFSGLRDIPIDKLDPNIIAMALFQGVGIIEEYDRLGRMLSGIGTTLAENADLIDPRRRIRTPIQPNELPKIDTDLVLLSQACTERIALARQSADLQNMLFDLSQAVHSLPVQSEYPNSINELTMSVNFPESLAMNIHNAWKNGPNSKELQDAIAAYDANAESQLD